MLNSELYNLKKFQNLAYFITEVPIVFIVKQITIDLFENSAELFNSCGFV